MTRLLHVLSAVFLTLHGLVHFMGTAVYLQFTEMTEFPYKTTLLGGHWDLGPTGIYGFGLLWAATGVGFWIAAGAVFQGSESWRPILLGVTLVSLLLTTLDWTVAYAGIIVNLGILVALFLAPRL